MMHAGTWEDVIRRRQFISWLWLPGWVVDPFKRCRHLPNHWRNIYGDEIIWANYRRSRCLDCGRLLPDLA